MKNVTLGEFLEWLKELDQETLDKEIDYIDINNPVSLDSFNIFTEFGEVFINNN